ncbi:MAG: prenyltransferase [Spirochaetia bacterium]
MNLKEFLSVTEIRTKTISLSSFFIGTLLAVNSGYPFSVVRFILMLTAVLGVDMGTTALNSYFDYKRGVDNIAYTDEKDKILVIGGLHPFRVLLLALALFGIAGLFGTALIFKSGWHLLIFGIAGMAIGFLYNGGPLPISQTPLGEIFAGGFLGPALIAASYYAQAVSFSPLLVPASIPSFFLIASILTVNNTCDIRGDKAAGRKTLSILIGKKAAELLIYLAGAISAITIVVLGILGIFPPAASVAAVPGAGGAFYLYLKMHQRGYSHGTKGQSMMTILLIFIILTGSIILGHVIHLI